MRSEVSNQTPLQARSMGMHDVVCGLFRRFQWSWLEQHHSKRLVLAGFSFISGCVSIALMSALAVVTRSPFIYPSLGPTAFLFFYTPLAPSASPRNTLSGHTTAVIAGYFSLLVMGLTTHGSTATEGTTWPRVIAAALALGLTSGAMALFDTPHPPAGATALIIALIIALGIMTTLAQLAVLLLGVVVLILQAIVINRLAGIPYPLWKDPRVQATSVVAP